MAPSATPSEQGSARIGPHPSYIEIAKPYILQSRIQSCLSSIQMSDAKEDAVRLQGVSWIDAVRRALSLPIRTFNTAVIYYHKFRLLHTDNEYNWADASAAALFTACKIEDTLKKSREILCASWNLKVGPGEALSSDDPRFDIHSKQIIGLERLMLESAGFDFRNRYPQKLMVKLARALNFDQSNEGKTAWNLSVDLYRTFAPLKQNTPTLAIACVELAARLHERDPQALVDRGVCRYAKWGTSRGEVMETLLDLLDLYTHNRSATSIGPLYPLETFINIRITLNTEATKLSVPRFTPYASETPSMITSPATPAAVNGLKARNGVDTTSPNTPGTPGTISPGQPDASAIGVRGQNGTVRFMLDAARARDEKAEVEKYYKVEEEEYEVEVPNDKVEDADRDRRREKKEKSGKNYWQKFRERKRALAESKGRSDDDDLSHTAPPSPPSSNLAILTTKHDSKIDSLGAHQVHPGRRELLASPDTAPADNSKIPIVRDSSTGDADRLGAHHVNAQRRELIAASAAPARSNGRARRQAKARQKEMGAGKGARRDEPDYTLGSRAD